MNTINPGVEVWLHHVQLEKDRSVYFLCLKFEPMGAFKWFATSTFRSLVPATCIRTSNPQTPWATLENRSLNRSPCIRSSNPQTQRAGWGLETVPYTLQVVLDVRNRSLRSTSCIRSSNPYKHKTVPYERRKIVPCLLQVRTHNHNVFWRLKIMVWGRTSNSEAQRGVSSNMAGGDCALTVQHKKKKRPKPL